MKNMICHNVISVTRDGITLESAGAKIFVNFDDCVKNYSLETGKKFSKCVATRDISTLTFTFYTHPKINLVFKRNFFKDIFVKKSAVRKFFDIQKSIVEVGYTSLDLS